MAKVIYGLSVYRGAGVSAPIILARFSDDRRAGSQGFWKRKYSKYLNKHPWSIWKIKLSPGSDPLRFLDHGTQNYYVDDEEAWTEAMRNTRSIMEEGFGPATKDASIRDQLVKLGSTNPDLRPHIRPILAVFQGVDRTRTSADDLDIRTVDRMMHDRVRDAIAKVKFDYDAEYIRDTLGDHPRLGQGADITAASEVSVNLGYIVSTGSFPKNNKLAAPLRKAADKALASARREYKDEYGDGEDEGYYQEYEDQAYDDEDIYFILGASYFAPGNRKNKTDKHMIEVFGYMEGKGYFLPGSAITVYNKTFTSSSQRELDTLLKKHLAGAVKAMS